MEVAAAFWHKNVGRNVSRGPYISTRVSASYFRGLRLDSKASAEGETPHVALTNIILPQESQERKSLFVKYLDRFFRYPSVGAESVRPVQATNWSGRTSTSGAP